MLVGKVVTNRLKNSNKPYFEQKKKNSQSLISSSSTIIYYGGANEDRTRDLLTASQALIPAEL
jgi:hypothetical protein